MTSKDKIILSLSTFFAIAAFFFLIREILLPFILSLTIAYLLNPIVSFLENQFGLSRTKSSSLTFLLFFIIISSLLIFLIPVIYDQIHILIFSLPKYFKIFVTEFYPEIVKLLGKIGITIQNDFTKLINDDKLNSSIIIFSKSFFKNAINSSLNLVNILSSLLILPILIFYFLKDWNSMILKIDHHLPKNYAKFIRNTAKEIDSVLSGYLHGQFNVCIILSIIYATLLCLTGLNFGFLVGIITGIMSFIPFVGAVSGIVVAITLSLLQWGLDFISIGCVCAVFILVQIIESNFLTPKLVGEKVGLHPVWIIFGLFTFGKIFGFTGVLLAVPLSAVTGVVLRQFLLNKNINSLN